MLGPALGTNTFGGINVANLTASVLPVPPNCNTVSDFSATLIGAQGNSSLTVGVGSSPFADIAIGDVFSTNVSCTLTAANGANVSCTSSGTTAVDTTQALSIILTNITDTADLQNTHLLTTFVCQ
jgi:hypothetical protein